MKAGIVSGAWVVCRGLFALGVLLSIQLQGRCKYLPVIAGPFDFIDNKPPTPVGMVFRRDNFMKVYGVSNSWNGRHIDLHVIWKFIKTASIN